MLHSVSVLTYLALAGCAGDGGKDSETTAPACEVEVKSTFPASGAMDFYYMDTVEFHLSAADDTATLESAIAGSTTTSEDGKTLYFTPDAPLDAGTSYTVTLHYCNGDVDLNFTTSDYGKPLDNPSSLVGHTYSIDLASANIVRPAGVGSVLSGVLKQSVLVGVESADASKVQMIGALSTEGTTTQDFCTASIPFPEADFAQSPFFTIGPADTVFSISGADITIKGLEVTGTFAADGSSFGGGTLAGSLDARDIAMAIPDVGTADDLCALIAGFGATCEACAVDGQTYCLTLEANRIQADGVSGTLMEVAASDCPGCDAGAPVCP